jgi:hypothetical protein
MLGPASIGSDRLRKFVAGIATTGWRAQFNNPFAGTAPIYGARIAVKPVRPFPAFGNITLEDPAGYSWYHSVQLRGERRFSSGYTFQVNYTLSKMMEAVEFLSDTDPMPCEVIASLDRPRRLAMGKAVGRGRRFNSLPKALDVVVGGWQLTGTVIRQAGPPLNFGNVIFKGNLHDIPLPKSERTVDRWFNTEAGFNRNATEQLGSHIRTFPLRLSGGCRCIWSVGNLRKEVDDLKRTCVKTWTISTRRSASSKKESPTAGANQTKLDAHNERITRVDERTSLLCCLRARLCASTEAPP